MLLGAPSAAVARTLTVGDGAEYAKPSDAARAAQAGDTIRILPGAYYDCAAWRADGLVIEGAGASTVLTDTTCQGKAIMVIDGRGVTVRDLTLARARVPDGNGAGIRAEAADLLVQRVRFDNDQDGVLAADQPGGVLRVEDCVFTADGASDGPHPTASLVVGEWASLIVRGSRFEQVGGQAAVLSRAARTEIDASRIDAAPLGRATIEASGALLAQDDTVQAAPGGQHAAFLLLPGGSDAASLLRHDALGGPGTLLLNWSGQPTQLEDNVLPAGGVEDSSAGSWGFRLRGLLHEAYDAAHAAAGALHRRALGWLR